MRIEIAYKPSVPDGRGQTLLRSLSRLISGSGSSATVVDVIMTDASLEAFRARDLFSDPVTQDVRIDESFCPDRPWTFAVETACKPGVTDTLALTVRETMELCAKGSVRPASSVQTARLVLFDVKGIGTETDMRDLAQKTARALHNPLIMTATALTRKDWDSGKRFPASYPQVSVHDRQEAECVDIASMDDSGLEKLSKDRLLALTLDEMRSIKGYFALEETKNARDAAGMDRMATDVELEMIAQTWSEHCKHKIFNAIVTHSEDGKTERIESLFKTFIKSVTDELMPSKPWLKSVFKDNSGIVQFDDDTLLCVKAETHNSPSALDPYGGAITGIVGVNRDILGSGIGAKPIFNTDVLCFGYPDMKDEDVPEGLLHPRDVLRGVHKGIVDGGNQSGIPTVAGGFLFDESFTGKPLVFCGSGGMMKAVINGKPAWEKSILPGHKAVMLGGRIGKDGIHGATFSSLVLDETSPVSAVQIGDPIIQRKMTDFLLEARDAGLYEGITDNGAGGISSSLGEMAEESGGIRIDLSACPLKYPGLSPWEILVSESQERMSLSVSDDHLGPFMDLARRRGVEASVIGEFTATGNVEISYGGKAVGLLSLDFLHRGLPRLDLRSEWVLKERRNDPVPADRDHSRDLLALLAEPNIASKETWVREYDHEVQARTVQKPFTGAGRDAPTDGAVLKPVYASWKGLTVTHGIAPRYSEYDTYRMAQCAVDEAMRAHVSLGGNPSEASALDNFCWPDPVESPSTPDGAYKLAQLVRACRGLKDACLAYGLPLVSGKDSMKNDASVKGRKISVKPTLLVTLMGTMGDVRKSVSSDFKAAGDLVYALGETNGELGCTFYEAVTGMVFGECPAVDTTKAMATYRSLYRAVSGKLVRSCHDLSDGGMAVALAECALGGRLGCQADVDNLKGSSPRDAARLLFCESPSRFVVSVRKEDRERFEDTMRDCAVTRMGTVTENARLEISACGRKAVSVSVDDIERAFKTPISETAAAGERN